MIQGQRLRQVLRVRGQGLRQGADFVAQKVPRLTQRVFRLQLLPQEARRN